MLFNTDQESFWAGDFGTNYTFRNIGAEMLAANLNFFARALRRAGQVGSCIEFGANIGMNLRALKLLYPSIETFGIEINTEAARQLSQLIGQNNVYVGSIFDTPSDFQADLSLIKGVLIHINPDFLPQTYDKLYAASRRWVLVCEYYSRSPVVVPYRGHNDRLFKRDFAGEMLDRFHDLALVDYGFAYHRDPAFPQDDVTWFLLEKRS